MSRRERITLNCSLAPPPQPPITAASLDGSHTPNTPDILNTIVNLTTGGPLFPEYTPSRLAAPPPPFPPPLRPTVPTSTSVGQFPLPPLFDPTAAFSGGSHQQRSSHDHGLPYPQMERNVVPQQQQNPSYPVTTSRLEPMYTEQKPSPAYSETSDCIGHHVMPGSEYHQLMPPESHLMPSSNQLLSPSGQLLPPSGQLLSPTGQLLSPTGQLLPPSGQILAPSDPLLPSSGRQLSSSGQLLPPSGQQLSPSNQQLMSTSDHQLMSTSGQLLSASGQLEYPYSHHHPGQQRKQQHNEYTSPEVEFKPLQQEGPPSVEHYRSQFIKEGLKLKVQQKLKEEPVRDSIDEEIDIKSERDDLTPEDEERRRRRRERNKIAATKCRNKKKERTTRLVSESELLEIQNSSLKQEVERLEIEKRHLVEVLAAHAPSCAKRPRRDSGADTNSGPGVGDGYCLPENQYYEDNNGNPHNSVVYQDLKYSESGALLPDSFLEATEATKISTNNNDELAQRRHFKTSCSFAPRAAGRGQDQQYQFVAKSRCLSYGFQMDNRCVAL